MRLRGGRLRQLADELPFIIFIRSAKRLLKYQLANPHIRAKNYRVMAMIYNL
jgi:hypothetical protein